MFSLLKDYFPLSKIAIIIAFLVPLGLGLNNYSDILFSDKSPIKRIINKNIKVNVGSDFVVVEINEKQQRKKIKLDCTKENCGLTNSGEYFLSAIEYANVPNYTAFFSSKSVKAERNNYYLMKICINNKCIENLQDSFLTKKHEEITSQSNAYVMFFIFFIVGLMLLPIGRESKSESVAEIERKYNIK